ncbi:MAG TPA: hypothetical protein VL025_00040 [Thermoanaerobaculia bacterium]|nr:hypothetical protein [Thermoanaerobaculia bacterium]
MKSSKSRPKTEDLKTIDPAVLEEILGGVSPSGDGKTDTVIPQAPFGSFFHS